MVFSAVILVLSFSSQVFAKKKYSTLQCDIEVVMPKDESTGRVLKEDQKLYIKGDKVRFETPLMTEYPIVFINNGNDFIAYDPVERLGGRPQETIGVSFSEMFSSLWIDYRDRCQQLVGSEAVDGRECDIYMCPMPKDEGFVKVWAAKDIGFPIKSSMGGFTAYYKNIKIDEPIDDSLFVLPLDIKVAIETLYDKEATGSSAMMPQPEAGNLPVGQTEAAAGKVEGNIGQ